MTPAATTIVTIRMMMTPLLFLSFIRLCLIWEGLFSFLPQITNCEHEPLPKTELIYIIRFHICKGQRQTRAPAAAPLLLPQSSAIIHSSQELIPFRHVGPFTLSLQ